MDGDPNIRVRSGEVVDIFAREHVQVLLFPPRRREVHSASVSLEMRLKRRVVTCGLFVFFFPVSYFTFSLGIEFVGNNCHMLTLFDCS